MNDPSWFPRTLTLFVLTAVAEIVGCYLPYQWAKAGWPTWVLLPAAGALAAFAWLLTLHPLAAGRTYAAYGGVYVASAVLWLWVMEGQRPDRWDLFGAALCLAGPAVIVLSHRG